MTAIHRRQRNVLFITADQWRGECLSILGHEVVKTPTLDNLAREGVLFSRHYAQAAPCGPSRASLHTGLYLQNHRSGTNGTPLDDRHTNWAREARALGYDPVLFGYTDTSVDPRGLDPSDPILRTYEGPLPGIRPIVHMGALCYPWRDWLRELGYEGVPDEPEQTWFMRADGVQYEDGGREPVPLRIKAEHHDTAFMVDNVIKYLRDAEAESPATPGWFVHLSLLRPHPPWIAPEPWNRLYDPEMVPGFRRRGTKDEERRQHPWLDHQIDAYGFRCPENDKRLQRLKATYYGLMSEVDHHLGRLFAFLKAHDQWDDTLVIVTSDHGEQMGDHWLLGKCGYFDESYHIPLIVRDPRREADPSRGLIVDRFSENVDIMPTMLEWIGGKAPLECDGRSLLPFVEDGHAPEHWRTEAHWEYDFRDPVSHAAEDRFGLTIHQCTMNIIRDVRYKYVHFTAMPPLFFDLEEDPDEFTNRADDPAYAERVLAYAQKMLSWRMNHDEHALTHIMLTEEGIKERRAPRY